ncbi:DUF3800 domain-containing protein [Sporosarcina cyprini]|uniref:DUF3800 domain-containing protein n=1 Tax=Sporosarcina cyprini TaxID=2910523 RepID=UPI001EDD38CD|nr:DUF3800 domain-containing protein [Sporosarcina cyprini]MCG3088370.1 DUF3800 domain-containing protein [Sporosarcina cyprini]
MCYEVNVFFDESGKAQEPLHFMGAASIPKHLHEKHKGQLNSIIKKHDIHWTKYSGHYETGNAIRDFIKILLETPFLLSANIISYNINVIERNSKNIKPFMNDIVEHTVYNKFPERVIYGVVRKHGKHTRIKADLFIEHDNVYEPTSGIYSLKEDLPKQLNIQSVYRNDTYIVRNTEYRRKKEDFGIEFIDLILGFTRLIVLNNPVAAGRNFKKRELLYELLKKDKYNLFYFMENIKLYEWDNSSSQLEPIDFKNYLYTFIGTSRSLGL